MRNCETCGRQLTPNLYNGRFYPCDFCSPLRSSETETVSWPLYDTHSFHGQDQLLFFSAVGMANNSNMDIGGSLVQQQQMILKRVGVALLNGTRKVKCCVFRSMSLELQIMNKIWLKLPGFMFADGFTNSRGTQFFQIAKPLMITGATPFRVYLSFHLPIKSVLVDISVILDGEMIRPRF
jgi:hypothetical protein